MSEAEKRSTISEFDFTKGILVATFSGIMSACFAFGLDAAAVVADISASHGTPPLWTGLPKLCIVLLGGFTTNAIWCFALSMKNHTAHHLVARTLPSVPGSADPPVAVPMLRNYLLCALAGVVWYFQFFFYSMGETQMGAYKFSSWTLHMASIIIFSSLWGLALHEWRGSSRSTRIMLTIGLATLILSTMIIGAGNSLGAQG
jgi:L-rhamnose-H+ transport protein